MSPLPMCFASGADMESNFRRFFHLEFLISLRNREANLY